MVAFWLLARRPVWKPGQKSQYLVIAILAKVFPILSKSGESKGSDKGGITNYELLGGG